MFRKLLRKALKKLPPPKHILSSDYAGHYGLHWHCVYKESPITRSEPQYFGSTKIDLTQKLDDTFPALGVLELNSPLVFRKSGWIFDEEGTFLPEFSWFGKHVDEIEYLPRFLPKGRRFSGTAVSLASDFAIGSYGHFIYDVISRLHLFQKAGFNLEDTDHIFCPRPTKGNAEQLFNQLGLPKDKLVWVDDEQSLRPQRLFAISFPGTRRNYPEWVSRFIQTSFIPTGSRLQNRRLFITRKGYRRNPSNLEEVENLLIQYGFEIYNPVQSLHAHLDFHEAEVVIGGSGSNLTGLIFCQPGTKVLELISDDHIYPYYYSISESAGLDFSCLVCKSVGSRGKDAWGPSEFDYHVDLSELEHSLTTILS